MTKLLYVVPMLCAAAWLALPPQAHAQTTINGDQSINATVFFNGDITVGNGAHGKLTITKNGNLTNSGNGYIGSGAGADGTVDITEGAGSWVASGDLFLGYNGGAGILSLANGGMIAAGGSAGTGRLTIANDASSSGTLNIGGVGAAQAAGIVNASSIVFGAGTGAINFNHTDTNYTFASTLSGAGTINQFSGTTRLSATSNSFTGPVNVTGGTLLVNGSIGASPVSVITGGTLGGIGSIAGAVAIGDGGILAPGAGVGTLTVSSLSLTSGAFMNFELTTPGTVGGGVNDLVIVNGNLALDGTLNITDAGGFGGGVYRLINYGGILTDNGLAIGAVPIGTTAGDYEVQTSISGQVNLVNNANISISFWDGDAPGNSANGQIDGGNGTWTATKTNWTDSTGSVNDAMQPQPGFAVFTGTPGTVTVDDSAGPVAVTGMQFAVSGYVVQGGVITLSDAQTTLRTGDGTALGSAYTATINSSLGGSGGLNKTDLGTLILGGPNTYSGATTISTGTLEVQGGSAIPDGSSVTIADVSGATLKVTDSETIGSLSGAGSLGGAVTIASGQILTTGGDNSSTSFAGGISGAGGLTKAGSGTFTLTQSNSYTGATTISAGILQAGIAGAFASGSAFTVNGTLDLNGLNQTVGSLAGTGVVTNNGGTARTLTTGGNNASTLFSGAINNGASAIGLLKTGSGTLEITGAQTYTGGTGVSGGTLRVNGSLGATNVNVGNSTLTGAAMFGGSVAINSNGIFAPGNNGVGTVTIGGALTLASSATLNFDLGTTSASDLINVGTDLRLQGSLNVADAGGFGPGTYRLINYGGALEDLGISIDSTPVGTDPNQMYVQTAIEGQINLVNTSGLTLSFWDGDNGGSANNGQIDGGSGTWKANSLNWTDDAGAANATTPQAGFAIFEGAAGTVTVDNSAGAISVGGMQFAVNGYTVQGGNIGLTNAQTVIRVGDGTSAGAGYVATISSALTGSGGVAKTDLGTLTLNGTSTYTGATTVSGGKLLVNGSIADSVVTVQSGATLGGNGTTGALTIENGGTVAPGTSAGVLQTGNFDLQNGGNFVLELNSTDPGSGYDQLSVVGTVTLAGNLTLTLGFTPTAGDLFFILLNDGADAIAGTFAGLPDGATFTQNGQTLEISYSADWSGAQSGSTFTGGNDVALIAAVPEPRTTTIVLLGLALLLFARYRGRRQDRVGLTDVRTRQRQGQS